MSKWTEEQQNVVMSEHDYALTQMASALLDAREQVATLRAEVKASREEIADFGETSPQYLKARAATDALFKEGLA